MAVSPRFKVDLFNQAVRDYGYDVLIEKSELCSCYQEEQSESTPVCPRCKGLKFIWKPYGVVRALLTGISEKNNQYIDFSMVKQGDKMMTLQEKDKVSINDRVKALNTYEIYTEVLIPVKQEGGINYFEPYFDIAEILEAKDESGNPVPVELLAYEEVSGMLTLIGSSQVEKLSVRYSYHPYYLVNNIPHTNRQQYDIPGNLMKLPGQYYLSRITAPVKTLYMDSLFSRDLDVDFTDLSSTYVNSLSKNSSTIVTFETCFIPTTSEKLVLFKREEHFNEKQTGLALASGSLQIDYSEVKPQVGDKLVFIRDKYIPELTFKDFEFNSLLEYKGGPILSRDSWESSIPEEGFQMKVSYDYIQDKESDKTYTFLQGKWVEQMRPFELYVENYKVYAKFDEEDPIDLNITVVKGEKNYLAFVCGNAAKFSSSYIYCNGTRYQMNRSQYISGLLFNAEISSQSQILKRIYLTEMNQYEMASNKNFIIRAR